MPPVVPRFPAVIFMALYQHSAGATHRESLCFRAKVFQSVHVSYGETEKVNARKLCPEMETPKMPLGTEVDKLLILEAVLKKKKKLFTETDVQSCSLLC